jgi:endo-1,4-beta-xylanase
MSHHPDQPTRRRRPTWIALGVAVLVAAGVAVAFPSVSSASAPLATHAAARGKYMGFALDPNRLNESQYSSIAQTEYNLVVAENNMKWETVEPNQNQFNFGPGNQVANWAQQNGKQLYGHTLVWHSQLPPWVQNINNSATLLSAMRNHITRTLQQWPNAVAWDVVNEAFADGGGGNRRSSVFQNVIGNSWIEEAFRAARAADPDTQLCINDYSTDGINAKSTAIFNLVQDFKARGVPIDCVGFQAHLILNQVPGDMQQNLQRFINLGVDVRITELDIRIPEPVDSADLTAQANNYRTVTNICLALARCRGITTWGITDRYSWVDQVFPNEDSPLLWDDNYNKKPAYNAVHDALAAGQPSNPPTTSAPPTTTRPPTSAPPTTTRPPTSAPPTTGGPPGACGVAGTVQTQWGGGYVMQPVTITAGSSAISSWTVTFTLPSGHSLVGSWNATITLNGTTATARPMSYNSNVGAGQSTSFGFQVSRPTSNNSVASGFTCTSP